MADWELNFDRVVFAYAFMIAMNQMAAVAAKPFDTSSRGAGGREKTNSVKLLFLRQILPRANGAKKQNNVAYLKIRRLSL
jgi:hypothetical protein